MGELVFHIPCGVNDKIGVTQLKHRIDFCVEQPSIILRGDISEKVIGELKDALRNADTKVSFNLGEVKTNRQDTSIYRKKLEFISMLRDELPVKVERKVGIKPGSAVEYGDYIGRASPFSLDEYRQTFSRHLDFLVELNSMAQGLGLSFEIENRPEPNYGFFPDGNHGEIPVDTTPRWGGSKWSPFIQFIGTFGAYSEQLEKILKQIKDSELHLDLEHLVQTCQFGSVFNLERTQKGILRARDLTEVEKEAMVNCGALKQDDEVLVDYQELSDKEEDFLKDFGFVARAGQAPVYGTRLSLIEEMNALERSGIPISGVTPGFQVYQGLSDNGKHIIGSRLPGITSQYIQNPELRARLSKEISYIHKLCTEFMTKKQIRNVELEFQVDDGTHLVYKGTSWEAQFKEGQRQLVSNLEGADKIQIEKQFAPHYLF